MIDIFQKGIELKIFIPIFRGTRHWFSHRFVMHDVKFRNKHDLHSTLTFEQTAELVLAYLTPKRRNSLDNMEFYQLIKAVHMIHVKMEELMKAETE